MIFTGGAPGGPFEDELWYLNAPGYNADIADEAVAFFREYLTHTKGRWKGDPLGFCRGRSIALSVPCSAY